MGKALDDINHEARERKIAEARTALNSHNLTADEKLVLSAYLSALEAVSHGVDSAHERITIRKAEHKEVIASIHDMAEAQALTCLAMEKIERNQKEELSAMNCKIDDQQKQARKTNIINWIMSGATIFITVLILLGGTEALAMLSGLANVLKVAQVLA